MRRALHLGVQKALGMVASHYQVDFEAISSGYVVPVGVEDEVAMNRADALAATTADMLAENFIHRLPVLIRSRGRQPSSLKIAGRSRPCCLSISIRVVWPCNKQLLV
jgi:hypothetical protein